jgi:hypothetical protein
MGIVHLFAVAHPIAIHRWAQSHANIAMSFNVSAPPERVMMEDGIPRI